MNAQLTLFSENAAAESLEKVMKFLAERGTWFLHINIHLKIGRNYITQS